MVVIERHCSGCGGERPFEQPPCADGHGEYGELCPEWACTGCGAAIVIGDLPERPVFVHVRAA